MEGKQLSGGAQKRVLCRVTEMQQRALFLGMAAAESDKDSGFSDVASECLSSMEQADSEGVLCCNTEDGVQQIPGTKTGPFTTLSPVLMMNNVFFRQMDATAGRSIGLEVNLKAPFQSLLMLLYGPGSASGPQFQSWAVHPSFEVMPQSQPQILFLPSAAPPLLSPPASSERRGHCSGYLPTLNSYAKIAPHPNRQGPALHGSAIEDSGGPSRLKRLRVENPAIDVAASLPRQSNMLPPSPLAEAAPDLKSTDRTKWQSSLSSVADTQTTVHMPMDRRPVLLAGRSQLLEPSEKIVQPLAKAATCSPPPLGGELCGTPEPSSQEQQRKSKLFQNTLDVLHRSGLLEITMKTKELARQNRATQVELDHLKAQMTLFMEAMQSSVPQVWVKLHDSLTAGVPKAESGLAELGILQVSLESLGM